VDRLKQLRETATVVALVGLALDFALTLASLLLTPMPDDLLLVYTAVGLGSPVLVALLAALVATCWLADATPRARLLTVLSLVLTAGQLATAVGLLVAGLARSSTTAGMELLGIVSRAIPWLTTAVITIGVFAVLLRRPSTTVTPAAPDAVEPAEQADPTPTQAADPQLQPGWAPEAAVGAVWRRAGDAAAGAPSDQWDALAQTTGRWGPKPAIEIPAQPSSDRPSDPPAAGSSPAERPAVPGDWSPPSRS
jgi:hypothetical protein